LILRPFIAPRGSQNKAGIRNAAMFLNSVRPGLVPGIHVLLNGNKKDVDGRVKPGHDDDERATYNLA
jgi:hypothetical protein